MKIKSLSALVFLYIFASFNSMQEIDNSELYKVVIFKWSKNKNGDEEKNVTLINQEGKIIINNSPSTKFINLKTFAKGVDKFIKDEKLVKENAYNGVPKVADAPNKDEMSTTITVIKLKDFNNEKDFDYNSRFISRKITKTSDRDIILYKYLQSDDLKTLRSIVK